MRSTGEVMGIDRDFATAFAKAQIGGGTMLPTQGTAFVSVKDSDKTHIVPAVAKLLELGFGVIATQGTADYLLGQGLQVERVNQVQQGRPPVVDKIKAGVAALIFHTTDVWGSRKSSQSRRS